MKKILIATLCILATIILLLGAVWAAAGPVAEHIINNYGPELVGRHMRVEKVKVNLPAGRVSAEQFAMLEADSTTPFVTFSRLDVQARLMRLLSHTIDISHISLDGLDAQILQDGSQFNFDDIIAHFASTDSLAVDSLAADSLAVDSLTTEPEGTPWAIELNNISIGGGHVIYKDLALDATFGLRNINLIIPALYFSSRNSDVDLQFTFEDGGTLHTNLAYNIEQGDYSLQLQLDTLNLKALQPYLQQSLNLGSFGGSLSADINLDGNLNHIMEFNASGTADLAHMAATDTEGAPLLSLNDMHIGMHSLSLMKRVCQLESVTLGGAHLTVTTDRDGTMNLARIFRGEESSDDTTATEPTTDEPTTDEPFALTVDNINLGGVTIDYTDHSMRQPFSYTISDMTLRSRGFDLAGVNSASLTARLNKSGRAQLRWSGTLHDLRDQKLGVNVENVRLRDFSPFCYEYTAYPLTEGNMTFSSDNIVSNSRLSSKNHLDIYRSTAGRKDPKYKAEYSNIPVRMGLYLLKDMEEHIRMDIPVSGTLGSPEFSFRKIVFRTIGNAMLKVVASPFVFLKGGEGANLHDIAIDATQYSFTTQQYESFDVIANTLKAKPELRISLLQHVNTSGLQTKLEQMALARDYHNSLIDKPTDRLSPMDSERIAALKYTSSELDSYLNSRLIESGMAADTTLNTADKRTKLYAEQAQRQITMLAEARNKAIRDHFSGQGIADSLLRVDHASAETKGSSRYIIEVALGDESVSLAQPTEETTAE